MPINVVKKSISIIIVFLICGSVALSQKTVLRTEAGIGTFYMRDLKLFQTSLIPTLGVDVKSLSSFPPYFGYGASFVRFFNSGIGVGLTSDFFSTGGRNYYKDYSGIYKLDLLTHAFNIGIVLSKKHFRGSHFNTYFEIQQGLKFSTLNISENLVVAVPITDTSYKLLSTSVWIKPGYRLEYKILKFLSIGTFIGGELNPKSKLHMESDRKAILSNSVGNVTMSWSGFRFALYISGNFSD